MKHFKDYMTKNAVGFVFLVASLVILLGIVTIAYDRYRPADEQAVENFQATEVAIEMVTNGATE